MTVAITSEDQPHRLSGKLIQCILPDDGTDKKLLEALREQMGIVCGYSRSCRSVGALTPVESRPGKLPPSEFARLVQIVASEDEADAAFDLVFETAELNQPGRGVVWQASIHACTPFTLPEDVADEVD